MSDNRRFDDDVANMWPDIARRGADTPRRDGDGDLYRGEQGTPAREVDTAEDRGQQVIAEGRERHADDD
jgi:hypothetical protein